MCLSHLIFSFFFFNDTATTEIYTLSYTTLFRSPPSSSAPRTTSAPGAKCAACTRFRLSTSHALLAWPLTVARDRKSTRLNSSHQIISYAVFCLKKKKNKHH